MVWRRLKRLWTGAEPTVDEGDEAAVASAVVPEPPDPTRDALAALDGALRAGDTQAALLKMRSLLLRVAGDRRVLERAAQVLARMDEPALAEGFARAAASRDAAPMTTLSEAFLELDDPEIALSLALVATARDRLGEGPALAVARAREALGDPQGVLDHLERFAPQWPSLELARVYGAAVVFAGAWDRWDRVAELLADDAEGAWVVAAAERARSFPPEEGGSDLQHRLFVRYGVVLIDTDEGVAEITPERLAGWLAATAALLLDRLAPDTRVAYVSPRSEVLARWLAESLGRTAIPLSARLPQHELVVFIADDDDLEPLFQSRALFGAPSTLVQAVKDPTRQGVPLADVIGLLSESGALPFGPLDVERASDRVPAKLLLRQLREAAGPVEEAPVAALLAWTEARRGHLAIDAAVDPEARASFVGW